MGHVRWPAKNNFALEITQQTKQQNPHKKQSYPSASRGLEQPHVSCRAFFFNVLQLALLAATLDHKTGKPALEKTSVVCSRLLFPN